ncbi:TPA: hypothetical protein U2M28_001539 [Providencia stuartii]|nr:MULTISPECIES: hypothetical protein [Providencia]MBG5905562.1 hypothetical protein [Providencia stuartii]MBG5911990.1 hypothetical protein [Providencia stuartii]MBG5917064.1 hypothetical protein [Providencia stuartii]MBG5935271.1 hypothetical protein [Providencia stuartii]SUC43739.1 Uncharacterised protein [Providencia stuartii]
MRLSKDLSPAVLPGIGENVGSSLTTEITNSQAQEAIKKEQENANEAQK